MRFQRWVPPEMKRTTIVAAALLAAFVAMQVAGTVLAVTAPPETVGLELNLWIWAIVVLGFTITGAVLAVKRPDNAVGWILLTSVTLATFSLPASEIARRVQSATPSFLAFASDSLFFLGLALLFTFLFGLFPTGRFPGPKWRLLGYGAATGIVLTQLSAWTRTCSQQALQWPTPDTQLPTCSDPLQPWFVRFDNPFGLMGETWESFSAITGAIGGLLILIAMFGGVFSLVARYRSGTSTERLQLRWLVSVMALVTPLFAFSIIGEFLFPPDGLPFLSTFVIIVFGVGVPVTIGIAILRHNLFDIDQLIGRTTTFTIVAVMLAVVYATIAVWLPTALTGGSSSLAVAASTLAVAALFNPLRRRVQRFVDRRFDRTTYDAEGVAGDLAGQLRDNVDAQQISQDWVDATSEALRPARASVWLRQPSS